MKHEVTTMNTKKTLAASLKKFMEKKPLSKVTVSEIVTDCGLNRKTFYYHFEDVYALLKWTLEEEAIEVVKKFDLMVDYEEAILFVMDYVDSNKHMINCAYDAIGSEEMKRFFFSDFIGVVRSIVDGAESNMQLHVGGDFKQFLCEFYTQALAGMLIEWFRDRNVRDREETISFALSSDKTELERPRPRGDYTVHISHLSRFSAKRPSAEVRGEVRTATRPSSRRKVMQINPV